MIVAAGRSSTAAVEQLPGATANPGGILTGAKRITIAAAAILTPKIS